MNGTSDSDGPELTRGEINPDAPEAFLSVYRRYRETVRAELESSGLEPIAAEVEVGTVFLELMNNLGELAPDAPLGPRLRELARAAAKRIPSASKSAHSGAVLLAADDTASFPAARSRSLGRRGRDGYYGSGL